MSLYARLAALAIILAALTGAWWKFDRMLAAADKTGYMRRAGEDTAAMQAQSERNRDLQREAEKRYTVQTEVRDRFIVQTITEVRHETDNLAACVLTPVAVRVLNAAAECASEDRPASCGAGEPVLPASAPH